MTKFKVGDIIRQGKKIYIVSGTKGWIHKDGWISLVREIGETSLLTEAKDYKLVKRREKIGKQWWRIFPNGEK